MPCCPAIVAAYSAFCASVRVAKEPLSSFIMVFRLLTFPFPSVKETPSFLNAASDCFVGLARLVMIARKEVPACDPFIPAFAIRPIATAVSSAENFSAPATGATYLNVSPISDTFVFALDDAAAIISAKCPLSFADMPKAVSASVTMSDVCARSSPEAAARFMMPSMPFIMSPVFHPAIAM